MALLDKINQGIFEISSTPAHDLGDVHYHKADKYIYVRAKTAVTAFDILMQTSPTGIDVVKTGHLSSAAVGHTYNGKKYTGAQILHYNVGGLTANAYSGYHLVTDDSGTGGEEGLVAIVETNSADHLYLDIALSTTVADGATDITLFNPYYVAPATASTQIIPVGVSRIAVTDEYYFWMQVEGIAAVRLGSTTQTVNLAVKVGDNTAGTGVIIANGNDLFDVNIVGHIVAAGASGTGTADTACWVKLNIR